MRIFQSELAAVRHCSCEATLAKMASREEDRHQGSRQSLGGQDSASEAVGQRHHRKGHRRSIMHANIAESLKVKQVLLIMLDSFCTACTVSFI